MKSETRQCFTLSRDKRTVLILNAAKLHIWGPRKVEAPLGIGTIPYTTSFSAVYYNTIQFLFRATGAEISF